MRDPYCELPTTSIARCPRLYLRYIRFVVLTICCARLAMFSTAVAETVKNGASTKQVEATPYIEGDGSDLASLPQGSEDKLNSINLTSGIVYRLDEKPGNPAQLDDFNSLAPDMQVRFYQRRHLIVRNLLRVLYFKRLIGGIVWTNRKIKVIYSAMKRKANASPAHATSDHGIVPTVRSEPQTSPADFIASDPGIDSKIESDTSVMTSDQILFETAESADLSNTVDLSISETGARTAEAIVAGVVDALWNDARYLASARGFGLTFGLGALVNLSKNGRGLFFGHGFSFDVGVNFESGTGYVRAFYDRQALQHSLLGMDLNLTASVGVHLLDQNASSEGPGKPLEHQRYPLGFSRDSGLGYRFIGWQPSFHALELVGAILTFHGMPLIGALTMGTGTVATWVSVYNTDLSRRLMAKLLISKDSKGPRSCRTVLQSRVN